MVAGMTAGWAWWSSSGRRRWGSPTWFRRPSSRSMRAAVNCGARRRLRCTAVGARGSAASPLGFTACGSVVFAVFRGTGPRPHDGAGSGGGRAHASESMHRERPGGFSRCRLWPSLRFPPVTRRVRDERGFLLCDSPQRSLDCRCSGRDGTASSSRHAPDRSGRLGAACCCVGAAPAAPHSRMRGCGHPLGAGVRCGAADPSR